MKSLLILLIAIPFLLSTSYKSIIPCPLSNDDPKVAVLTKEKSAIDWRLINDQKSLILFAKVKSKKNLISVKNQNWPDDVDYSYNVLKDKNNKVVMILAGPTSESGDWDISYIHYFDKDGNTIAFERRTNFFNSQCTNGVAYEVITKYYDSGLKMLKEEYELTNKSHKPLNKSKCVFPYDFKDYKIYKNVNECLAGYNIQLN